RRPVVFGVVGIADEEGVLVPTLEPWWGICTVEAFVFCECLGAEGSDMVYIVLYSLADQELARAHDVGDTGHDGDDERRPHQNDGQELRPGGRGEPGGIAQGAAHGGVLDGGLRLAPEGAGKRNARRFHRASYPRYQELPPQHHRGEPGAEDPGQRIERQEKDERPADEDFIHQRVRDSTKMRDLLVLARQVAVEE